MGGGRTAATVVLGGAAAAMLLVMVAPAAIQRAQDRMDQTVRYPSGAAAKADRTEVPRWLPDSATGIAFLAPGEQGERLIRATLPGRALPADCTPASPAPDPHLRAHWFPTDTPRRATAHCGQYDVALVGDQLYGWRGAPATAGARTAGPTG
ncbi:hypothetical protein [Kitasatospora sp. NPDC090308]|uniref:hypothetical protein n=1 Tax=Kitasatospora sp. NPDC090308 TaxID=3364082 RepID=UPI00381FC577